MNTTRQPPATELQNEVGRIEVALRRHKAALGRLADTLEAELAVHAARHRALIEVARDIARRHPVPDSIAAKLALEPRKGEAVDDESFEADLRAFREREMIVDLDYVLDQIAGDVTPQNLRDVSFLDRLAAREHERGTAALINLQARIAELENQYLFLTQP